MATTAPAADAQTARLADDDLAFATVTELRGLIERRVVSPVEVTTLALDRLERLGPRYNAVAAVTAERALAEARRAEREIRRGRRRGPLHGIPYGAKDLLAARGAPTTWGAPPLRDQVFDHDAGVIEKLGAAGGVLAAKLAMVELAGGGGYRFAGASLQGPGRTPWDPERWSGGSSSGSGAAVAAGLVPYAIGSETSGSIITPASYCGVTGLRPTFGLVTRRGAMVLSWTLDKLGPMARSAEDCALVLEAMAGGDRRDEYCAGRRFGYRPRGTDELRKLHIGLAPADFEVFAAEEARPVFAEALRTLRGLGAELVEASLPRDLPYGPTVSTIIGAEGATSFAALIESERFEELADEKQKDGLRKGLSITARDYLQAMQRRTAIAAAFAALFERVDVLVGVGRGVAATPIDEPLDARPSSTAPSEAHPELPANAALIPAGNLAGLPALCLPCGFTTQGLPMAVQLVGPRWSETTLLSLGAWFQSQTDWHRRRPPVG